MSSVGGSVACILPLTCEAGNLGGSLADQAAHSLLESIGSSLGHAAAWIVAEVWNLISTSTTPSVDAGWFQSELVVMEQVVVVVILPILLAASVGPVLRQDGKRLVRVWFVGLPVAVLAGFAASQAVGRGIQVVDLLCRLFLDAGSQKRAKLFIAAVAGGQVGGEPLFVQGLLSILTIVGTLLVWLELVVRSAALYVATIFTPLALIGFIWPATLSVARRAVEVLVSLVLSKFVIVVSVVLGMEAFVASNLAAAISGAAILLLAGFAPFALLRLAPVVETSAIAQLEGMSHRPLRAGARAVSSAAGAPFHPVTQLVMAARHSSSGDTASVDTRPVVAQAIPEHQADFPTGPSEPGSQS
ncbi:MAG: hypothetical protein ACP5P1_12295 [Acidimicrobiales bacterium]